ncbi:iron-containing redox enzyme family protein [Streptomyces sp. ME02-6991-2A]|uniref:iron-containing redox enzyme family protein n=1 Tax=Streptomyces sp. ME02-6991-2A TaxID=3028677 RepID=UPI0029BEAE6B|nr:iron-containing redox enzyme family protein [Streptomyces sp. ME02-6991-2A]MDX3373569.1 iron-containing redox enzyme family protein [Streptomyces sp. ME02-6991-2A]
MSATPPATASAPPEAAAQRTLHRLYRQVPGIAEYAAMTGIEERWILPKARAYEESAPAFGSAGELLGALKDVLANEEATLPESHTFLAEHATLEQFKVVVREFALDGLTESESLLPVVPRLPYRSGMAVFRVLIDELGCGNEEKAHSQLYRDLLDELGMSLELDDYLEVTSPQGYAYVNMFHWLASRAVSPQYFLGAYAYFESSVLYGFQSFARAAQRLGIVRGGYYSEHLYIDEYHSNHMRTAIRTLEEPDLAKIWAGVRLTSDIVGEATETAIALARAGAR